MAVDTKTGPLGPAEQATRTNGFDAFSYEDLAEDAGTRKVSEHHHSSTKAAISVALIKQYCANFEATCVNICANHNTGAGRVTALMELYRNAFDSVKSLGVNRRATRDLIRGVKRGHCVWCFAALWRVCLSYSERVPKRMLAARPALF
jgi:TetR/AcrR family transcriptional repressor of nem operon